MYNRLSAKLFDDVQHMFLWKACLMLRYTYYTYRSVYTPGFIPTQLLCISCSFALFFFQLSHSAYPILVASWKPQRAKCQQREEEMSQRYKDGMNKNKVGKKNIRPDAHTRYFRCPFLLLLLHSVILCSFNPLHTIFMYY